ncbi:MAG: hypothetical protein ACRC92_11240 [Peptostreptococcaceae bacterium]
MKIIAKSRWVPITTKRGIITNVCEFYQIVEIVKSVSVPAPTTEVETVAPKDTFIFECTGDEKMWIRSNLDTPITVTSLKSNINCENGGSVDFDGILKRLSAVESKQDDLKKYIDDALNGVSEVQDSNLKIIG